MKLLELKQKRAALINEMTLLANKAANESRGMDATETDSWQKMVADEKGYRASIEAVEQSEELNRSIASGFDKSEGRKSSEPVKYDDAFKAWYSSRSGSVTPEVRDALRAGLPDAESRDLTEGTGAAGGYTVPTGFWQKLVDAMKFYGGVRQTNATVIQTATGQQLQLPTDNDATAEGSILGENGTDTSNGTVAFSQVTFNAYKYTSGIVPISMELLQDSAFSLESVLVNLLGKRVARIQNRHFTVGTGTAQPQGLVSSAATVTALAPTAVSYQDLLNLKFGVDAAYRNNNPAFMMNDQVWALILALKDSTGRPLINGVNEGIAADGVEKLLNVPVKFNQHMVAAPVATAKTIAFGDFSAFTIRDVMGATLIRFNERFMDSYKVGFSIIARADARYVNAGTDPIKVLVH